VKVSRKKIAIVGAGGFARELKWLIDDINAVLPAYLFAGYLVSDVSLLGEHDSRDEVLGDFSWLENHGKSVDCLAMGIGTPSSKIKVADQLSKAFPTIDWPVLIHPSVKMDRGSCTFGQGAVICAGSIGTVNLRIGAYAMINLSCTIGHEAVLGKGCVLNPTVNISGGVSLEEGVLIGTGAQVLQYVRVGKYATVGAGAVVTKDVMPGSTVVGIPAKPIQGN